MASSWASKLVEIEKSKTKNNNILIAVAKLRRLIQ
jgi:hypothetical protein